jgi:hypothetical protein
MNTLRMGVITICVALAASGYLSLRRAATDEAQPAQATRVQTANFAASHQAVSRSAEHAQAEHALDARSLNTVSEPAFEPDTTELVQPSLTLDELLDAINADIGPEGEQVDREALAEVLRSDPELTPMLTY